MVDVLLSCSFSAGGGGIYFLAGYDSLLWKMMFLYSFLVGGFSPTHLKHILVKMGSSSPIFRVKINNI